MKMDLNSPEWQPLKLLSMVLLAALLYISWAEWQATRALWDAFDLTFFRSVNDSLKENNAWAALWAIANNRTFDTVGAILFTLLLFAYARNGAAHDSSTVLQRLMACTLLMLIVLVVTQLDRKLSDFQRLSPTLVLDDVLLLSEKVTWIVSKDKSANSFPGDHGTVSLCIMLYLMIFGGRRYMGYLTLIGAIAILPRLVSGAHWATDIIVGSAMLTLPTIGLMAYTPYFSRATGWLARYFEKKTPWAESLFMGLTNKAQLYTAFKGMGIGVADIIPGVSGSTIAFILGIYKQLLHTITRFNRRWFGKLFRLEWRSAGADVPVFFIVPLAAGIVVAIILFTRLIPMGYLLEVYPEPVYGLFFGLIAGSILLLCHQYLRVTWRHIAYLLTGVCFGYLVISFIPADTPDEPWFIFLCGVIAICAMLLPGLSGSFILLVLGKYALILDAIGELDLTLLLPFITGCLVGLVCFAHLFYWVLQRYYRASMLFIIGVMLGCLRAIWPFQERIYTEIHGKNRLVETIPLWPNADMPILLTLAMVAGGLIIVCMLHLASRHRQERMVR